MSTGSGAGGRQRQEFQQVPSHEGQAGAGESPREGAGNELEQCFSKGDPGPAATASPGNLLEMQIPRTSFSPTSDLISEAQPSRAPEALMHTGVSKPLDRELVHDFGGHPNYLECQEHAK